MDEIVSDSEAGGNNTAVLWVIWQMSLERAWRERTGDNAVTCEVLAVYYKHLTLPTKRGG